MLDQCFVSGGRGIIRSPTAGFVVCVGTYPEAELQAVVQRSHEGASRGCQSFERLTDLGCIWSSARFLDMSPVVNMQMWFFSSLASVLK